MQTFRLVTAPQYIDLLFVEVSKQIDATFGNGKTLVHYARDPVSNAPFGTVAAKMVDGVVQIGWAMANPDRPFKKKFERQIAEGRAEKGTLSVVPLDLDDAIEFMVERAKKYYRVDEDCVAIAGVY